MATAIKGALESCYILFIYTKFHALFCSIWKIHRIAYLCVTSTKNAEHRLKWQCCVPRHEKYVLILSPTGFCSVISSTKQPVSWGKKATGVIQVTEVTHELQGSCGLRANRIFWHCISCVVVTFNIITPLRMHCVIEKRGKYIYWCHCK